jgi:hypothetical protein
MNDAIFGAIYYRMILRSGPLTRRFGEELGSSTSFVGTV